MKKILLKIFLRLKYPEALEYLKLFKSFEYKSIQENLQTQKRLLYEILKYSVENVPYYRKIAKEQNIVLDFNSVFEQIKKFPILKRQILKEEFDQLKAEGFKGKYIKNTTGG